MTEAARSYAPSVGDEEGAPALSLFPAEARPLALALWREVERHHPDVPLMGSADWTDVWLNHYGPSTPHRFAIWHNRSKPVAVALIAHGTHDREGLVSVQARHLGTSGEPDVHSVCVEYNALLCLPPHRTAVWNSWLARLAAESDWDELRLDGFAAVDVEHLSSKPSDWQWDRKPARYVDLNEVRQSERELITFFGDSTRKGIRQNLRRFGHVVTEWAETVEQATEIFSELVTLHQRRWRAEGKPGCYSSPVFTAFHRELLERLVPQGRMVLFRAKAGGRTLGCSQLLIDRNRVLLYQGGRIGGDSRSSPGLVNDYLAMRESLHRGYAAFDFMAGDTVHKQRLSTHADELVWGVCRRPRLKFALMDQLRQIKRWLRALRGGL